jgi:hypothetical protein
VLTSAAIRIKKTTVAVADGVRVVMAAFLSHALSRHTWQRQSDPGFYDKASASVGTITRIFRQKITG